ncbi:MAG: hypothetical protein ACP5JU_01645 [Minisyncoccia bacterium]
MEEEKFEEELEKELYKEKPSERIGRVKKIWGVKRKEPEKYELWEEKATEKERTFNLKKIFFIILSFFVLSVGLFVFVLYYRSIFIKGVSIDIIGPLEVNSLIDYSYSIKITNNSLYTLKDVKLDLSLKNGAYFKDDISDSKVFTIGDIEPRSSQEIKVDLIFLGKVNQIAKISSSLTYSTERRNQYFQIDKDLGVNIKSEALTYQIFKPSKIFIGEPFIISIKVMNNSDKNINLNLKLDTPESLEIVSLSPPPQELLTWQTDSIPPNSYFEIDITSKFKEEPINPVINLIPKIIYEDREFDLDNVPIAIKTIKTPITLKIETKPEESLIDLDKTINYKIYWENKSTIDLNNVVLKVYLEGPFDFNSISTNGYFSPFEKSIIWDARNKPSLYDIKPQTSDYVEFNINLIKDYPPGSKNLEAKVRAVLETESIPPEIQVLTKKFSVEISDTKIIPGKISIKPLILFKDTNFTNTGPFPLQKGQKTTLSFYLLISTYGEDFENVIIKTKIPIGVALTGSFAGEFNPMNLSYNQDTGDWVYRIDELSSGYGNIYGQYSLIQQIEVTPPLYGDLEKFVIIPQVLLTARGKYSGKTFEISTSPITIGDLRALIY